MNFLAHAYLSFNNPDILVGNLIADFVKGKQMNTYPDGIRQGIVIHREIDYFTDNHPLNIKTKSIFSNLVGKYSGSFLDVSFDYFLANDADRIPSMGWQFFADSCYKAIERKASVLPTTFCSLFMYMKSENWFNSYQHKWMIERSFKRLQRRAKFLTDDINVFPVFDKNSTLLQNCYDNFFPELEKYVHNFLNVH